MFPNLRAEMARSNITNEALANTLKINPATMSMKLNIPGRLKLSEAKEIKKVHFRNISLDFLFEETADTNNIRAV